ncbi:uncharacterized protein N7458_000005 [Penicillium daleae]|uniref:Uncharacterized protein n=1 Tax=Penicillium daleae TaxID=63821 RepID=A0AAD6CI20_9EURO|nr:uncharacterized protein N7458_000005 [Penicillium daleae]KAJ5464319.1 hypothetical protein N7458_000005 [Penicillium daleae]
MRIYNGVRKGDIWFVLNDFSLVLATIVTSLENFLKLTPGTELDMLDVMGGGEAHEMEMDGTLSEAAVNDRDTVVTTSAHIARHQQIRSDSTRPVASMLSTTEKVGVTENWDDDVSDGPGGAKEGTEDAPNSLDVALELAKKAKEKEKARGRRKWAVQSESEEPTKFASKEPSSAAENDGDDRILLVLKAFKVLQEEFNAKFRAMWA